MSILPPPPTILPSIALAHQLPQFCTDEQIPKITKNLLHDIITDIKTKNDVYNQWELKYIQQLAREMFMEKVARLQSEEDAEWNEGEQIKKELQDTRSANRKMGQEVRIIKKEMEDAIVATCKEYEECNRKYEELKRRADQVKQERLELDGYHQQNVTGRPLIAEARLELVRIREQEARLQQTALQSAEHTKLQGQQASATQDALNQRRVIGSNKQAQVKDLDANIRSNESHLRGLWYSEVTALMEEISGVKIVVADVTEVTLTIGKKTFLMLVALDNYGEIVDAELADSSIAIKDIVGTDLKQLIIDVRARLRESLPAV